MSFLIIHWSQSLPVRLSHTASLSVPLLCVSLLALLTDTGQLSVSAMCRTGFSSRHTSRHAQVTCHSEYLIGPFVGSWDQAMRLYFVHGDVLKVVSCINEPCCGVVC